MIFTVLDQNGVPMTNVTVMEEVTPASTVQNAGPVLRPDGKVHDMIGRGSFGPPLSNAAARAVAADARNTPNQIEQNHTMTIMSSSGKMAVATHQRTMSNVDANGNLRPVVSMRTTGGTYSNNYTFSHTPIKVQQVPAYVCPRVFR